VNVRSLQVDTDATCLAGKPIAYELETDGPLTPVTSDGRTLELAGLLVGVAAVRRRTA
jgi:hypothetical protein